MRTWDEHPKAAIDEMGTRSDPDVPQSVLEEGEEAAEKAFADVMDKYYPRDGSPGAPIPDLPYTLNLNLSLKVSSHASKQERVDKAAVQIGQDLHNLLRKLQGDWASMEITVNGLVDGAEAGSDRE